MPICTTDFSRTQAYFKEVSLSLLSWLRLWKFFFHSWQALVFRRGQVRGTCRILRVFSAEVLNILVLLLCRRGQRCNAKGGYSLVAEVFREQGSSIGYWHCSAECWKYPTTTVVNFPCESHWRPFSYSSASDGLWGRSSAKKPYDSECP